MRSRSWRRWKGSGCCSALSLRSATCATYSDQWHRGGCVERNSHRSGVYRPATEQRGPLCTVERRCHAPRSADCDECPGRGDHKGGARNLSSVYQAFTLSGQCTGKRDMFFLRARHFHLLHFPRFGGFLFCKAYRKRGIRPSLLDVSAYCGGRQSSLFGRPLPRIHIAKCQMRICPALIRRGFLCPASDRWQFD